MTNRSRSLEGLSALRDLVAARDRGEPVLEYVLDDIATAAKRYLKGVTPTMDEALGLKPGLGQCDPRAVAARETRNAILRKGWKDYFPGHSARAAANKMAPKHNRYRASSWQIERTMDTCPTRHVGTIMEAIWHSLRALDADIAPETLRKVLVES